MAKVAASEGQKSDRSGDTWIDRAVGHAIRREDQD
jgi:hypothetical protein